MEQQSQEEFATGLKKIRLEIKTRLIVHGLFGTITDSAAPADIVPDSSTIQIAVNERKVARTFERKQIEGCHLRVSGPVLQAIIAMIEEIAAAPP